MEIEATPPLTESELEAVRVALARLELDLNRTTSIGGSAWRQEAAREAVDSEPSCARYARSPRRTRGATRA